MWKKQSFYLSMVIILIPLMMASCNLSKSDEKITVSQPENEAVLSDEQPIVSETPTPSIREQSTLITSQPTLSPTQTPSVENQTVPSRTVNTTDMQPRTLKWQTVAQGIRGHYNQSVEPAMKLLEPTVMLLQNQQDFSAFWTRFAGGDARLLDEPIIDFETYSVVVFLDNEETTNGHSVGIAHVEMTETGVVIHAQKLSTERPCVGEVREEITQPYHIVQIPRIEEQPISLSLYTNASNCKD